jgi:hypothetical protein
MSSEKPHSKELAVYQSHILNECYQRDYDLSKLCDETLNISDRKALEAIRTSNLSLLQSAVTQAYKMNFRLDSSVISAELVESVNKLISVVRGGMRYKNSQGNL